MRFRFVYIGLGIFFTLLLSVITDPDTGFIRDLPFGAGTVASIVVLLKSVLYTGFLHISRKGLMDYVDLEALVKKAMETSEGAGSAVIGVGVYAFAIALAIFAATR